MHSCCKPEAGAPRQAPSVTECLAHCLLPSFPLLLLTAHVIPGLQAARRRNQRLSPDNPLWLLHLCSTCVRRARSKNCISQMQPGAQAKARLAPQNAERCPSLPVIRYEECRKYQSVLVSLPQSAGWKPEFFLIANVRMED